VTPRVCVQGFKRIFQKLWSRKRLKRPHQCRPSWADAIHRKEGTTSFRATSRKFITLEIWHAILIPKDPRAFLTDHPGDWVRTLSSHRLRLDPKSSDSSPVQLALLFNVWPEPAPPPIFMRYACRCSRWRKRISSVTGSRQVHVLHSIQIGYMCKLSDYCPIMLDWRVPAKCSRTLVVPLQNLRALPLLRPHDLEVH